MKAPQNIPSISLSDFVSGIEDCLADAYGGESFWVRAEVCDVNKKPDKRWCYLKLIEKEGKTISVEIAAVFWSSGYAYIEKFEKETRQSFKDGIEITCRVKVTFHKRWGLKLEVLEIDYAYALGKLEEERQKTLERLLAENPSTIRMVGEQYYTYNKSLPVPTVVQRIALITAPDSDGQRDFKQELQHNPYGYAFVVEEFTTQIQGDKAHELILAQLKRIETLKARFDVVAIVRGGGSQLDLKAFDAYELAQAVAHFPLPIYTGIGHDRNTSIVDLMARQEKTPTKVAQVIIQRNYLFERSMLILKERLQGNVAQIFYKSKTHLKQLQRIVNASDPSTILKKGFAIIKKGEHIFTDGKQLVADTAIEIQFEKETIYATVTHNEL